MVETMNDSKAMAKNLILMYIQMYSVYLNYI